MSAPIKGSFEGGKKVVMSSGNRVLAAQCVKITEEVSFNIASEASYVYILTGQF